MSEKKKETEREKEKKKKKNTLVDMQRDVRRHSGSPFLMHFLAEGLMFSHTFM